SVGGFVTASAILFQAFHDDPIEIAFQLVDESRNLHCVTFRGRRALVALEGRDAGAGADRILLTNGAAHRVDALREEFIWIERRFAGEELVEKDAERIALTPRVDIHA